jgi:hypothetical protein
VEESRAARPFTETSLIKINFLIGNPARGAIRTTRRTSSSQRGLCHEHLCHLLVIPQNLDKGIGWDGDIANILHLPLPLFLLFQELSFARDVSSIAFSRNVFSHGTHILAGNDVSTNSRLDSDFEKPYRCARSTKRHRRDRHSPKCPYAPI